MKYNLETIYRAYRSGESLTEIARALFPKEKEHVIRYKRQAMSRALRKAGYKLRSKSEVSRLGWEVRRGNE